MHERLCILRTFQRESMYFQYKSSNFYTQTCSSRNGLILPVQSMNAKLRYFSSSVKALRLTSYFNKIPYEPRYEKTGFLHMRKQRRRSASRLRFAVTAKLISAFVFAAWIVQSHFYLNPNFQALSLAIFCDCTARFVSDLVGNPEDRFSHNESQIIINT